MIANDLCLIRIRRECRKLETSTTPQDSLWWRHSLFPLQLIVHVVVMWLCFMVMSQSVHFHSNSLRMLQSCDHVQKWIMAMRGRASSACYSPVHGLLKFHWWTLCWNDVGCFHLEWLCSGSQGDCCTQNSAKLPNMSWIKDFMSSRLTVPPSWY